VNVNHERIIIRINLHHCLCWWRTQ